MQGVIKKGGFNVKVVAGAGRDTAVASGDQVYAGIGFKPKAVFFFVCESSSDEASWGFDDGANAYSLCRVVNDIESTPNASISDYESAGNLYRGRISAFSNDGFTITWTRTGAPTGTLSMRFIAIG